MKQMYVKIYTVALYTEQAMIHNDYLYLLMRFDASWS
jgi:hypothetical protein